MMLRRIFLACCVAIGFPLAVHAQLRILSPNGGESYFVGGSVNIRWTGIPAADTVTIEYSTDRGRTWNLITDRATGLQHLWRPVPNVPSDSSILRISSRSASTDSILYLPSEFVTGRRELIAYAEFSRDGTKVIGTSNAGHVFIWDAFTKAILLAVQPEPPRDSVSFTQPIAPARISPDGLSFAVTGPFIDSAGSFVRIYDAVNGDLIREWSRPQWVRGDQTVSCAYSPDGTRLLVTGQRYGLIYDVSNASQVALLEGYSDSGGQFIRYGLMADGDWTVDGSVIVGWDHHNRMVISNAVTGDTIKTIRVDQTFNPSYVRLSPDNARFISAGYDRTNGSQSPRVKIWDTATGTEVLEFRPFLRFARWADYSSDGTYIAAVGSNSAGRPDSLTLHDPATGALLRVAGTHSGNMLTVDVGPDPGRILVACNDGARIYQAPTAMPGQSDVSDGVWSIVRTSGEIVTISIPVLEARQGEFVDAPLIISNPASALATGATRIDVELSFNATLLDPIGATPKGMIANGIRTISISAPLTGDTLLTNLRFRAALGNDSTTALDLDSARADLPGLTVVEEDGEFRLLDLCYAGGARLVNPDGVAALRVVSLDRHSETAEAELRIPEFGSVELFLSDIEGRTIRTFLRELMEPDLYRARIDLAELPDGQYFLVLKTSDALRTVRMEVVR